MIHLVSPPDAHTQGGFFIPEVHMSVESEITWLRFMVQIVREQAVIASAS